MATTGTGRTAQVVEQARLVLHVAEQDDRVRVARLEDRREGDALVEPALGVAQHDVVAVAHRLDREGLDRAGEERVAEVADDRADEHRRRAAQAARQGIGPVAEVLGGLEHPRPGLGGDRHARRGVVEDPRDRALRDPCHARDVAHRRHHRGSLPPAMRSYDCMLGSDDDLQPLAGGLGRERAVDVGEVEDVRREAVQAQAARRHEVGGVRRGPWPASGG